MNRETLLRRVILCTLLVLVAGSANLSAQKTTVASRVAETVDDTRPVRLQGNVHPMARAAYDQGALADSQPMTRMLLLLQRSPEQELVLQQLMDAQQTKGSGNYHAWLTPEQFGTQYGPSDSDVQAVTDWLTRQGFQVAKVATGRTVVEFSGNVAQVRNAFHTEIHRYLVNGEERFANVSDPAIPQALAPVVSGVVALHNFPKVAHVRSKGLYRRDMASGQLSPLFTYGSPANFALGPGDFATIYNIPGTAVCAGVLCDGRGQSIAVVGQSNINTQDVCDFRNIFNLTPACPAYIDQTSGNLQVIVNGPDPGVVSTDEGESDLDVEWAGAIAPAAKILFVTSQSTLSNPSQVTGGVDLSALFVIDNNLAPVLSESYGACEAGLGATGNAFYKAMWQQAAAEGITVAISSGDSGSAGCDPTSTSPNAAVNGVAVSGIASTPYNVAVGGTDFDRSTQTSTYWNTTSGTLSSALSYMPETTWDDSLCAINYPTACTSVDSQGADVAAGSGGPSNCAIFSGSSCSTGYSKPAFQVGGITPNTTGYATRLIPDVSFFASNGQNGVALVVCQSDANPSGASCNLNSPYQDFSLVGGTSAGTPTFAAVMALVNQKTGQRQGNANYVLYGLAAQDTTNYMAGSCQSSMGHTPATTCVYNDVNKGNNSVACLANSPNCNNTTTSGYGVLVYVSNVAFASGIGYDLATGLGSINVTNLLNSWSNFKRTATTTTLSNPSGVAVVSGLSFSVKVTMAPTSAAGDVSLIATTASGQAAFGPFTLVGGSVTATTDLLPPGTTSVVAYYGGDATHAASTSAPLAVAVTGANQMSKTTVGFVPFDANNNPILPPITTSASAIYGSPYILQIAVTNSAGTSCTNSSAPATPSIPCPTGTVTLTDNGNPLNDYPNGPTANATNKAKLNNQGIAEDQPVQLAPGSHSIVASYAGDPNYQAGTSNTLSVTISKATPVGVAVSGIPSSITSGTSVTFTAYVVTSSNGAGPTTTVASPMTFTNGSASIGTAQCQPTSGAANTTPPNPAITAGTAYCKATLTASISSLYPPPGYGPRTPAIPVTPILLALASLLLFALGWRWMPQPRRRAYAYAGLLAFALLAAGMAGCGGGGGGGGGGRTATITASYPGDANYTGSSGQVQIAVQ